MNMMCVTLNNDENDIVNFFSYFVTKRYLPFLLVYLFYCMIFVSNICRTSPWLLFLTCS